MSIKWNKISPQDFIEGVYPKAEQQEHISKGKKVSKCLGRDDFRNALVNLQTNCSFSIWKKSPLQALQWVGYVGKPLKAIAKPINGHSVCL